MSIQRIAELPSPSTRHIQWPYFLSVQRIVIRPPGRDNTRTVSRRKRATRIDYFFLVYGGRLAHQYNTRRMRRVRMLTILHI